MRIRSHLLLLAAVTLVPGFLAATIAVEKVREGERQAALRGLRDAVRSSALLVDAQVERSLGALTSLGNSPSLQRGDFAALYKEAQAIDRAPDVWTLVLDESGTQILNTRVPFGTPPPPPVAKDRVARVLATQQPLVTGLIRGPVTQTLLTTIYLPAKPGPVGRFVVAQGFSVEHWKKTALQPQGRPDWVVGVIDSDGHFISRSHRATELLGQKARPELVAAAKASNEGLVRHSTLEGVESYDAFVHSALTGWTVAVAAPVQSIEASATQAVAWLTGGVLVALATALVGGTLLSRELIQAIGRASASARLLGSGERPRTARTPLDEVNELNAALEDAGLLLTDAQGEREALAAEREELLSNEQAARAAAEEANRAKDKFLAVLGHELRNPLAAIAGATETLLRGGRDAATSARLLQIVQRQNRHLRRIVDDLLDVSRMLLGKIVLNAHPLDLATCVRLCVASLQATEQGKDFGLRIEAEEAWVHADPIRIEQIISNLVTNAMKYSPPGGDILVQVKAVDALAMLRVIDRGIGMAPDLLDHIFEPFVQGPLLPERPSNGLGIGLPLVRQLAELHGGHVRASSAGTGMGSCFEVSLPLVDRAESIPTPTIQSSSNSHHILLVEDNADARESTAELLRCDGYDVTEAEDGDAALEAVKARTPDLVVMDIGLPGKSGYEVARLMRDMSFMQTVPLLALSGFGQPRDKAEASEAGFDVHLVKPIEPDDLFRVIEERIGARAPASCPGAPL